MWVRVSKIGERCKEVTCLESDRIEDVRKVTPVAPLQVGDRLEKRRIWMEESSMEAVPDSKGIAPQVLDEERSAAWSQNSVTLKDGSPPVGVLESADGDHCIERAGGKR